MVRAELDDLGSPYVLWNQRQCKETRIGFAITATTVSGSLLVGSHAHRLEDFVGVYTRLMDDQLLPEVRSQHPSSVERQHFRAVHETLTSWCEVTPARVVNRAGPMGSNSSKPYQAQLIQACGFSTPDTLITNQPELVEEFRQRHGRVIYKSMSGIRSIVQTLEQSDLDRLHQIRWCPVQFQAFVNGEDVRVHTVGKDVFATAVRTDATDYRYASRQAQTRTDLRAIELPTELAARCVHLSQTLGLAVAGIDLKITPDGEVFCFEVNPSPAFSYFEAHTGQPIARAIANYLRGEG
jgi:glutathione synthase/RimK-type ligase-like ATP-grasp enzyme